MKAIAALLEIERANVASDLRAGRGAGRHGVRAIPRLRAAREALLQAL
jgi:hypothetical protein